jgi:hypothetical protein
MVLPFKTFVFVYVNEHFAAEWGEFRDVALALEHALQGGT